MDCIIEFDNNIISQSAVRKTIRRRIVKKFTFTVF